MLKKAMVMLQGAREDEILKGLNQTANETVPERLSTWDNVLQLLGLCILLIIILIAAYYTSKFVGRYKLGQTKNSNIKIIESYRISTNKLLQIVKVANKYLVIGVCKDQITYITELDEDEVLTHEVSEAEKQSFRQVFEKLKGNKE